jgi:hypothetical protein
MLLTSPLNKALNVIKMYYYKGLLLRVNEQVMAKLFRYTYTIK